MNDFLSHLVAKSLNATEVLRPRLPTLFEPTKGSGGLLSEKQFDLGQAEEPLMLAGTETLQPSIVGHPPETRPPGTPVLGDRSNVPHQPLERITRPFDPNPDHLDERLQAPTTKHRDTRNPAEELQSPPSQPAPARGNRLPEIPEAISQGAAEQLSTKSAPKMHAPLRPKISPPAENEQNNAAVPQIPGETPRQPALEITPHRGAAAPLGQSQSQSTIQLPIVKRVGSPLEPELLSSSTVTVQKDALVVAPAKTESLSNTRSEPAPVQTTRFITPAVAIARPQVTRHVERFTQVPDAYTRGTPETVPTIQVTIGRIEVRATPAPTQHAKKPRSAPSVMTLDEYLSNRGKGEGR